MTQTLDENTRVYDLFIANGFTDEARTLSKRGVVKDAKFPLSFVRDEEYQIAHEIAFMDNPATSRERYKEAERSIREYFILRLQKERDDDVLERLMDLNGQFITLVGRRAA